MKVIHGILIGDYSLITIRNNEILSKENNRIPRKTIA